MKNDRLYERLREVLQKEHAAELLELAASFGLPNARNIADTPPAVVKEHRKARGPYTKKGGRKNGPSNVVEPAIFALLSADSWKTAREVNNGLHTSNREVWARVKRRGSLWSALDKLHKKGKAEKRLNSDKVMEFKRAAS